MSELHPPESHLNGGELSTVPTENAGSKRQRRPSVRLGDIGNQPPYETTLNPPNRRPKHFKLPNTTKSSKTTTTTAIDDDDREQEAEPNFDPIGTWNIIRDYSKSKRNLTKRVRSTKIMDYSKIEEGREDRVEDGEYRDFEPEGSDSPIKEVHSPIDNFDGRVSMSDTDGKKNWNNSERNGVRVWLNQLGLGRYAPVFEIHEVDDEVLPMLTLEDLKDMGINAVGSRRKMYSSIQKLGKGFS